MDFALAVQQIKDGQLSIIDQSGQLISFIGKLDAAEQLKECDNQAAAICEYLKRRKMQSDDEHNAMLKVKLKIQHRLGEVLLCKVTVGRPAKNGNGNGLPEGISHSESSHAQKVASVPWAKIEKAIDKTDGKASQTKVLKDVGAVTKRQAREPGSEKPERDELVDPYGVTVMARCRDAWNDPWIGDTIAFLEKFGEEFRQQRIIDGMAKRARFFPFISNKDVQDGAGFIIQYIDQLIDHLKEKKPHACCPSCKCNGCPNCHQTGLVPEAEYKQILID